MLEGEYDLRTLGQDEINKRLVRSVAIHDAWLEVDYANRREYLEGGDHIPIVHKKGIPGCYCIRSTKSSDVQFWEAVGVLEERGDKLIPMLLTVNSLIEKYNSFEFKTMFSELPGLKEILVN